MASAARDRLAAALWDVDRAAQIGDVLDLVRIERRSTPG
jgi:hypothetical protein